MSTELYDLKIQIDALLAKMHKIEREPGSTAAERNKNLLIYHAMEIRLSVLRREYYKILGIIAK